MDLAEIQRFGTRLSQGQRKALGFWPKKGTRFYPAPTYTVLRALLIALDLNALADVLTRWLQAQAGRLPAAQQLLRSAAVNLLDCVITADPFHYQTESAQFITQEKGGDYVLGVKDNQPTVRQNAQKKLAGAIPLLSKSSPTGAGSKPAP